MVVIVAHNNVTSIAQNLDPIRAPLIYIQHHRWYLVKGCEIKWDVKGKFQSLGFLLVLLLC